MSAQWKWLRMGILCHLEGYYMSLGKTYRLHLKKNTRNMGDTVDKIFLGGTSALIWQTCFYQLRCTSAVYWNQQNSPLSKRRNCDANQRKLIWITALCINFSNDSSQWESKNIFGNPATVRILLGSTHGTWNTHNCLPDCSPSRFKRLCLPCLSVPYNRLHFAVFSMNNVHAELLVVKCTNRGSTLCCPGPDSSGKFDTANSIILVMLS